MRRINLWRVLRTVRNKPHTQHTQKGLDMSNPYDLRFQIYTQAQGLLEGKYYAEMSHWERLDSKGVNQSDPPVWPTHEQILAEAEKIYTFVQKQ